MKSKHDDTCASLTVLLSNPPQYPPCNCGFEALPHHTPYAEGPGDLGGWPEKPTNPNHIDIDYFKKDLTRLIKSLPNRTPEELGRYLRRLAAITDPPSPAPPKSRADHLWITAGYGEKDMYEYALSLELRIAEGERVRGAAMDFLHAFDMQNPKQRLSIHASTKLKTLRSALATPAPEAP